ncbi:MAG: dihydroorotate dehydrogenase electron transfer subunit [Chlamydiota bacterium]|nr:dihydroorotate dehydrogenase electron transfer subunit [Chlamydiota bacterium]
MKSKPSILDHKRSKNTPVFQNLTVVSNEKLAPDIYRLRLAVEDLGTNYQPGQFAMLRLCHGEGSVLPRPYSIHWAEKNLIEFLYKVYGKGSAGISRLRPNELVSVLGPLGNSFTTSLADEIILVAGGIGIAPFVYLVDQYFKNKRVMLFTGNQNKSQVILTDVFSKMSVKVIHATDDGSVGVHGLITDVFKDYLENINDSKTREIFVCGPKQMEIKVAKICADYHMQAQFAMEEYMACGMGVCMGCVIPCQCHEEKNYKRVCIEGPVFYGHEICWDEMS